jgi:hypothetical protein
MNARSRETHIPIGPLLAAAGGILLIVSLGLDWYADLSGFNSFEFLDLLLVVLALVTLASLAAALGLLRTPLRPGTSLVVGAVALLIVLSQLVNHPPAGIGDDEETGLWLGLGGAALMMAGAILSTARIAIAVEPRTRASAASTPPAGSAPPAGSKSAPDQAPTVADEPRP